jgi:hypothetical protein
VPRNSFVGLPIHRVDLRLEKRAAVQALDGRDYGAVQRSITRTSVHTTTENASDFGKPQLNPNVVNPRSLLLDSV